MTESTRRPTSRAAAADALVTLVQTSDDATLVATAVRDTIGALVGDADHSLVLEELAGEELTVGAVVDACQTPPFLADRRVIVVRDVGRWSDDEVVPLVQYVADPLPTTRLVLVGGGGKPAVASALAAAVRKNGRTVATELRQAAARKSWVVERIHAGPVRLDAAAGERLREHAGEDVGRIDSLLEALAATHGEGARIGRAELEPFLGEAGGVAPWDLTNAVDRGDTEAALLALHRMLEGGRRHPLVVIGVLHTHYAALLRLDGSGVTGEKEAAALLGIEDKQSFRARALLAQAQRLGSANVARAIELLSDADLDLKGEREWPDHLVLEVLVARLSRMVRPAAAGRRR